MNLADFNTETLGVILNKLIVRTNNDMIHWKCEFPIELDDPNKRMFYLELPIGVDEVETVYFERNYDALCMGEVIMFWWYDNDQNKVMIPLDYTSQSVKDLVTAIQSQTYRRKVTEVNSSITDLDTWLGE